MMEQLKATLLKPFEISSFADPAVFSPMMTCRDGGLCGENPKKKKSRTFAKTKILIFGVTGVVGYSSARHRRRWRAPM